METFAFSTVQLVSLTLFKSNAKASINTMVCIRAFLGFSSMIVEHTIFDGVNVLTHGVVPWDLP